MALIGNNPLTATQALAYFGEMQKREYKYMFGKGLNYRFSRDIQLAITGVADRARDTAATELKVFSAGLKADLQNKQEIARANERIARGMHDALLHSYAQRVTRRQQVSEAQYAGRRNRYTGKLRKALAEKDMVVATPTKILYINELRLAIEARHWARLNFGVAPASTPPPQSFPIKLINQQFQRIGFQAQPRPPMFLPAGFFQQLGQGPFGLPRNKSTPFQVARRRALGRGDTTSYQSTGGGTVTRKVINAQDRAHLSKRVGPFGFGRSGGNRNTRQSREAFFPLGGPPIIPTKGIVGTQFADAGLARMADLSHSDSMSNVYGNLLREWIKKNNRTAGGKAARKEMVRLQGFGATLKI